MEFIETLDLKETPLLSDDKTPDPEFQRLCKNLLVHEYALILIKQRRLNECQSKPLYMKVLQKTYEFLIKFVHKNPKNQEVLSPYIHSIFYDDMEYGVGAAQLIGEIVYENPALPSMNMQAILKKMIDICEATSIEKPVKGIFMKYLGYFMKADGKILSLNQIDIITKITSPCQRNLIYLFNTPDELKILDQIVEDFKSLKERSEKNVESLSPLYPPCMQFTPRLAYSTALLQVFSVATEGKNGVTEVKCQNMMKLNDILELYARADLLYPLKLRALQFLIDAYLDIEKQVPDETEDFIWSILTYILEDLTRFFDVIHNDSEPINKSFYIITVDTLIYKQCTLIKHMRRFVFKGIVMALQQIFQLRLRKFKENEQMLHQIIRYLSMLLDVAQNPDNEFQPLMRTFKIIERAPLIKKMAEKELGIEFKSFMTSSRQKEAV